jgi:hypothetical protein
MYINVEYLIEDNEYDRLQLITEEYKKQGLDADFTPEKMFCSIMRTGSKYDKDEKFKFHEWKLGLREDWH